MKLDTHIFIPKTSARGINFIRERVATDLKIIAPKESKFSCSFFSRVEMRKVRADESSMETFFCFCFTFRFLSRILKSLAFVGKGQLGREGGSLIQEGRDGKQW